MNSPDFQNPELSIVIPVYNERDNLIPLEEKLEAELTKLNKSYEIILIDDGSNDGSAHLIESMQKHNPRIRLIQFGHNHGQSAAFAAGFKAAKGKVFVTLDADLQNNPADIPLLLEEMEIMMLCVAGVTRETTHGSRKSLQKLAMQFVIN